jgi:zinc D-Ala-D-Ala carboxypeptidase
MNLTEHFTLAELTGSDYAIRHGINNTSSDHEILANLHILAQGLERVRHIFMLPLIVSSGYRSPRVNAGVGGSKTSAHLRGLAADFIVPGVSQIEVCRLLADKPEIGFDQLIYEGRWCHISFPEPEHDPAGIVLTATFHGGKATYSKGITA